MAVDIKLPRLPLNFTIVEPTLVPTLSYSITWNTTMDQIESFYNTTASLASLEAEVASVKAAPFYVVSPTGALDNETVLSGGPGVTLPGGAITVNVATALGFTPANKAGDTFTGAVDVQSSLRCDSLRIDVAASASAATTTHSVPINLNGTTYYILLSSTP